MDITTLRIIATVASFAAFLAIVWWAYKKANKSRFEADALLVFSDDEPNGVRK
jgi:cytochrome c oxidase cbb3-type subunit IV